MDDLISRQQAIEAVKFYETFCDPYPRVVEALEELPSVKPRKGKWINIQLSVTGDSNAECDQCGAIVHDNFLLSPINFCPSCGADMRGDPHEGSD